MSQLSVAFLLLIGGVLAGWRSNVLGMACLVPVVVVGVYVHGRLLGEDLWQLLLHCAEGLVIFEAAYLLGALLAHAFRRSTSDQSAHTSHEHWD